MIGNYIYIHDCLKELSTEYYIYIHDCLKELSTEYYIYIHDVNFKFKSFFSNSQRTGNK